MKLKLNGKHQLVQKLDYNQKKNKAGHYLPITLYSHILCITEKFIFTYKF